MADLYSPSGVEPFLEYQSASPPVSPRDHHSPDGTRDGYFGAKDEPETSVAWSRRKSVSSKSPSSEYPPRPIFASAESATTSDAPLSSPSDSQPPPGSPSSSSIAPPSPTSPGGGVSALLRRKSSRFNQQPPSTTAATKKPSLTRLARKASHGSTSRGSNGTASSPSIQPLALPPHPHAPQGRPTLPPIVPVSSAAAAAESDFAAKAAAEAVADPDDAPPTRLSTQLERPTPPRTPDPSLPASTSTMTTATTPSTPALFQPSPQAVANRTPPYAAVAGPPPPLASAGSLHRSHHGGGGASSRRTSGASSYNDGAGGLTQSSGSSVSSSASGGAAFGSPGGGAKPKAAADLSNPWRSQTERPLDTVRRLSRLVDHKDLSYQANRHSSYGAAALGGGIRLDELYSDSSSSSSVTPSASPMSPWSGGLPSSMSMTGPYPTSGLPSASMAGPYPMPGRTAVTPFALEASPWPIWHAPSGADTSSDSDRSSRRGSHGGTVRRKGTGESAGTKPRRGSDVGPAGSKPAKGVGGVPTGLPGALQAPTYSRSPLSQASSPEPTPTTTVSAPASPVERPTVGRSKSAKRRLSFWRKPKDGAEPAADEKADVVPPLPASPAGVRMGKGGGAQGSRVVSGPQTVGRAGAKGGRRAASEPPVGSPAAVEDDGIVEPPAPRPSPPKTVISPPPASVVNPSAPTVKAAAVAQQKPAKVSPAPAPAKPATLQPTAAAADSKSTRNGGSGFGSLFRRFTMGRKRSSSALTADKARSTSRLEGVDEMGQRVVDQPTVAPTASSSKAEGPPSPARPAQASAEPVSSSLPVAIASKVPTPATSARSSPGPNGRTPSPLAADSAAAVEKSPSAVRRLPQSSATPEPETPSELPWAVPADAAAVPAASNGDSPKRQLPKAPPSPSPQPSTHAFSSNANLSPYSLSAEPQSQTAGKPGLRRQASHEVTSPTVKDENAAHQVPPPLVRASSTPSSSRPTTPPPAKSDRKTNDLSFTSADVPALDDTPSHSHASSSSIATPSFWDPATAPNSAAVLYTTSSGGGDKPSAHKALIEGV